MTGLLRTGKRLGDKIAPKEIRKNDPLNKAVGKGVESIRFSPKIPTAQEGPVIPLPDEEALGQARRRQRSRRRGARASTVLTGGEDDTLG